jgi:predicted LPLAT superfamily acyltransferase
MMADRSTIKKHYKELEFFDAKANFNKNPFEIAYKTQKPLIVVFVIYQNLQTYKLEFLEINMDKNKIQEQEVQKAMRTYVKKFEAIISEHPNQWFNFYNFWEEGK